MNEFIAAAGAAIALVLFVVALVLSVRAFAKRVKRGDANELPRKQPGGLKQDAKLLGIMFAIVTLSRMLFFVFGYGLANNWDFSGFSLGGIYSIWIHSDAPHYLGIAEHWYRTVGDPRFHIVFFPGFPVLVSAVNVLFNDFFLSGLVVSDLALTGACFYLYKYAALDLDKASAGRAVRYLLLFPVAFFLSGTFSESIFILCVVAALYYARKGKFALACAIGCYASFTRSLGVVIALPILVEMMVQTGFFERFSERRFWRSIKSLFPKAWLLFIVPVGLFSYLLINQIMTGDWFTFLIYQKEHWYQEFAPFFQNISTLIRQLLIADPDKAAFLWGPQVISVFFALAVMIAGARRERFSSMCFSLFYFFMAISPTWLLSTPRYLMAMIPIYLTISRTTENKYVDIALSILFLAMQIFMLAGFVNGQPIY